MKWIKKKLQKISTWLFLIMLFLQSFGITGFAAEAEKDIDLNDRESILSWIEQNIPDDLNELPKMPEEWWEKLLPNQRTVAQNLAMPAYRSEEYAPSTYAFTPVNGDQVAYMQLANTGILDGYGKTLWKITNGGSNAYCIDHGASCKRAYAYGNFQKLSGEVAYLIEKYGSSSTTEGYFCIQMAIWALQSASTEEEAWSYAYTWYLKSCDESEASSWATTTVSFFKMANGKSGSAWLAEGPAGSQRVAKYEEFVTQTYSEGETPGETPGGNPDVPEPVEPEFDSVEETAEVSYKVTVEKTDWQTGVGLSGCTVEIYENGEKVKTAVTDSKGKASYETSKTESFSAEYCTNYAELTEEQQAEITCFSSFEEAKQFIDEEKKDFKNIQYTYQCKEITAPKGYVWKANEKSVKISGNDQATLKINNERTLGAVELIKYDTESESGITQGDANLKGAVYGIYAAEDIIHQDQKTGILYKKDTLITTAQIGKTPKQDSNGYILNTDGSRHIEKAGGKIAYLDTPGKTSFGDLELGKYYIQEITPSEGYLPDKTKYEVTFTYKDQMVKVEMRDETAKEAENTLTVDDKSDSKTVYSGEFVKKQGIQFVKTSDNAYQTELKPIEGAGFSVYLISELSGVKSGEIKPVTGTWGSEDILTFYDYDFKGEAKAVLYKRKSEPWTAGDTKWLKSLGNSKYEVAEMFTDENGRIETPELPYGTYVIVETTTPEYHKSAKPFIAEITEDSRILKKQRIINNTITETYLRIAKADEEFLEAPGTYVKAEEMVKGTVLKEGARYLVKCLSKEFSKESLLALNWIMDREGFLSYYVPANKAVIGTMDNPFETAFLKRDGKIRDCYVTLPQKLPAGSYELVEVTAPEGYVQNGKEQTLIDTGKEGINGYEIVNSPKEKLTFTLDNGSVYPDGQMGANKYALYDSYGNLTVTILQKNQEQKGIVEIYKHGEQLADVSENMEFLYKDAPVEGAKFHVVAEEDIYTQELDWKLLDQYEIKAENYLLHKKGDVIGTIITDRNGWGYLANLYIGKYKIVEVTAGNGFVLNRMEKPFEITAQDQNVNFDIYCTDYENQRQKLEIEVEKSDKETKQPLEGAVYGVYAGENIYTKIEYSESLGRWILRKEPTMLVEKDTLLAMCKTDSNGKAVSAKDWPLGNYYVKELEAPNGYLLSADIKRVEGTYDSAMGGQMVNIQKHRITYENKSSVCFFSKQELGGGMELPGAKLELYQCIQGKEVLRESWISKEEPHLIKGLPLGVELILRETNPAPGYVTAEEITLKLLQGKDEDANVTETTECYIKSGEEWVKAEEGMVVMKDDVTRLQISKKDITTQEELPGATLEIYDEKGNLMVSWVSEKEPHYIEKLPIGKYRLVERRAPQGFDRAEDIWFEILDTGEIQSVEMFDRELDTDKEPTIDKEKPEKPSVESSHKEPEFYPAPESVSSTNAKTGDSSKAGWFVVMGVTATAVLFSVKQLKKCKRKQ